MRERASERVSATESVSEAGSAEQAVRCKRTSEWRSEWPSTLRVDFIAIPPNVQWPKNELKQKFRGIRPLTYLVLKILEMIYLILDGVQITGDRP